MKIQKNYTYSIFSYKHEQLQKILDDCLPVSPYDIEYQSKNGMAQQAIKKLFEDIIDQLEYEIEQNAGEDL